jgi:hypothetical protein
MYKNRKFSELVFLYLINISFVLYIIVLLGIGGFAPKYLRYLRTFLQIYIGILLVIRYNPFTYKGRDFGEFDRQLVFSSGIFLLLSTALIGSIEKYLQNKTTELISTGISSIANIANIATTATTATIYK